jgi:hypothetical protein
VDTLRLYIRAMGRIVLDGGAHLFVVLVTRAPGTVGRIFESLAWCQSVEWLATLTANYFFGLHFPAFFAAQRFL